MTRISQPTTAGVDLTLGGETHAALPDLATSTHPNDHANTQAGHSGWHGSVTAAAAHHSNATDHANTLDHSNALDHASTNDPTASQKAALAGTGTPSGTDKYVNDSDARMTNARTPAAHASTHNSGGADVMAVDAAAGTPSLRSLGTTATTAAAGNDSRLSDARTPTAHAASHQTGADKVATGVPDGTKFLRDDFAWAAPTAVPTDLAYSKRVLTANFTLPANTGVVIPGPFDFDTFVVDIGDNSVLEFA